MRSYTKTRACAKRTRKRVGRILTMGEAHGTSGKAGQASRVEPARRLPFHAKPIPPCGTSHEEQPLMPCQSCGQERITPRKTAIPHEPATKTYGFYPAAFFVNSFAKHTVALRIRQLHNSASGLRIREVSRCVRLAVRLVRLQTKYIPPQRDARQQFRAFGNCCRKTLEYHPLMSIIVPVIIPR